MTSVTAISTFGRRRKIAVSEIPPADLIAAITPKQKAELRLALCPTPKKTAGPDRVKVVGSGLATDSELRGQGHIALELLGDDDLAQLSGGAILKLLRIKARAASVQNARHDLRSAIAQSRGMTLAQWEAQFHGAPPPPRTSRADQVWARAYAAVAR
jgi:hypothetical protein